MVARDVAAEASDDSSSGCCGASSRGCEEVEEEPEEEEAKGLNGLGHSLSSLPLGACSWTDIWGHVPGGIS